MLALQDSQIAANLSNALFFLCAYPSANRGFLQPAPVTRAPSPAVPRRMGVWVAEMAQALRKQERLCYSTLSREFVYLSPTAVRR